MIISSQNSHFNVRLRELWHYRDLISLFVRRDFVAHYKQTILGPLWHFINPLLTTFVFTIVFGRIAKISTDGLPQFLFYFSGTILWGYFSTTLSKVSMTFISNAVVFEKVYFPRLVVPISTLLSNLIAFGIQLLSFLAFFAYFSFRGANIQPTKWILLTPILILMLALFSLGGGIIIASLTTRYRDLNQVITLGIQLSMYATPIIYPVSSLPEHYQKLIFFNPLSAIIETFRLGFFGTGTVTLLGLAYSMISILVILCCGLILFNRVERTFMDRI